MLSGVVLCKKNCLMKFHVHNTHDKTAFCADNKYTASSVVLFPILNVLSMCGQSRNIYNTTIFEVIVKILP